MKYEINLFPGKRRWEISLIRIWDSLKHLFSSPVFLIPLLVAFFLVTLFWVVIIPIHKISPIHNAEIRNLELILTSINNEKTSLIREEKTILQLKEAGFRWEEKLALLGRIDLGPLWITRLAFEEEKEKGGPPRPKGEGAIKEFSPRRILIIDGQMRSRDKKPQVGQITRLIESLNRDPSFSAHFDNIELKGIKASREEPEIINFQLVASPKEEGVKGSGGKISIEKEPVLKPPVKRAPSSSLGRPGL